METASPRTRAVDSTKNAEVVGRTLSDDRPPTIAPRLTSFTVANAPTRRFSSRSGSESCSLPGATARHERRYGQRQVGAAAAETRGPLTGAGFGGAMISGQCVCLMTWRATDRIHEPHPDWCGRPTTNTAADRDQRTNAAPGSPETSVVETVTSG